MKTDFEYAVLDFTQVEGNPTVKQQGKVLCIKTSCCGWYSPELSRCPSRQDLAVKTQYKFDGSFITNN